MEITDPPKPSIWYILGVVIASTAIGLVSLYYAGIVLIQIVSEISSHSEFITFEKTAFYLFGAGLTSLVFAIGLIYSKVFNIELSDKLHVLLTRLIIGGLVLMFALPQIAHFTVSTYMEDKGYQICREKSHRWLHVVTIVYTKTLPCNDE